MEKGIHNTFLPDVKVKSSSSIQTSFDRAQLKSKQHIYLEENALANN